MRRLNVLGLAIALAIVTATAGCSRPKGPNVTPVGQVAAGASDVMKAGTTALLGLEIAADQVPELRKPVGKVAGHLKTVGETGQALARVLEVYRVQHSAAAWRDVIATIGLIRATLNAAIDEVPDGARRERVRGILQPIFDALISIVESITPPLASVRLEELAYT